MEMNEKMYLGMCSSDNSHVELSLEVGGLLHVLIFLIMKHEGIIYLHVVFMICLLLDVPY